MDYLSNLQNRTKWKSPNNNFKVGEIVIIKENNTPPATWPLGKLIETHPEKAQMAEIRSARGRVKASLTKLENTFDEINTRNEIYIPLSRLDDLFKEFE
ncbi:hypothetical protein TNCV_3913751 [Trichonephila clavipes]|nr:hypothetical protein TNCV_3913751 [Trichonephila clavipes]